MKIFKFERSQWKNILKVLVIRYSFGLVIGLLLIFILPFDLLYRGILAIILILPVGLAIIPFAVEFDYTEKKIAGTIANLTIIISFILIWIVILLLGFG